MFNNNIAILPHWIKEFAKVISYLGVVSLFVSSQPVAYRFYTQENVFVSVVESHSWDGTAEMLDEWKAALDLMGVRHLIRTRDQTVPRPASTCPHLPFAWEC
jgi:hypothetical protein